MSITDTDDDDDDEGFVDRDAGLTVGLSVSLSVVNRD